MIVGYGYKRDPEDLRKAGASQVWIDLTPGRYERADMMRGGGLREGDTLLLISLRDLGGSPVADERWQQMMAERGVTLQIIESDGAARKVGAPRKYDPDAPAARRHWSIWTNGTRSERDRLTAIAADYGSPVSRQSLFWHYGSPKSPKPQPE